MKHKRIWILVSTLVILGLLLGGFGCAKPAAPKTEMFPEKNITILVSYSVGGGSDRTARVLAAYANAGGENVRMVVVNMTGSSGAEACLYAKEADPDGYVLLTGALSVLTAPLFSELGYSFRDYEPLVQFSTAQWIIHAQEDAPWNTLQEFVDDAKKNPGKYIAGIQGIGSSNHIVWAEFKKAAGIDLREVPYDGSGPAKAALMGGEIDVTVTTEGGALSDIREGLFTGLAFTNTKVEGFDFGTIADAGIDTKLHTIWRGIFAPKGTPPERMDTLANIFKLILENKGTQAVYKRLGEKIDYMGPDAFRKQVYEQNEVIAPIVESIK